MARNRAYGMVLMLAILVLTGCGGRITTDLYVEDVFEVAREVEMLLTPAVITLESPSNEYNDKLEEMIFANFRGATNFRTESQDWSTFVVADVKVPIVKYGSSLSWVSEELLAIVVNILDSGDVAIGLALNQEIFQRLLIAFNEESWQSVSIKNFELSIKLLNDKRDPVLVQLQGVYANKKPIAYEEMFELQRRDSILIELADVFRDFAYEDGMVFFGAVQN